MRVLTFVHSFELGGVERIALRLVRRWREIGVDAPLFVGRVEGDMHRDVGAGLDFFTPPSPPLRTASWETLWMILTLPRAVRRLRPDILFCPGNSYTVVAVALKLLLGRDCPPMLAKVSNGFDRRDMTWWQRGAYRFWLRMQGRYLDLAVGLEEAMEAEICEALRLPAERVATIPDPALSLHLIERLRTEPRLPRPSEAGRRFVSVGRLVPQKNFALMLRAFHRGAAENDTLTIIGDGPERARLAKLAADLDLDRRVEFRGYVADPSALLPEFDVCLLSSDYEGVPAAVLEALAARVPIVATDCCRSMAGLLLHGVLGELVAVGDERAFADAIANASPAQPDDALSLAQARRFTIDHAGEAYLQEMRRLLPRPAGSAEFRPAATPGTPVREHCA
ncbi:glycosyltransferase [Novosphingobium sp. G106]|uniref:glycosyltransferase n=1 Tax=Novosphingobium sp. G106 TaxID=2849500 RepID=UPI001C2DE64E|nr:glycosyltransferase [Novosphingobium sp. G106]MBV1687951.1 glycosyltransferase [Novosphingobium sp. G106]